MRCIMCPNEIDPERLELLPQTRVCQKCAATGPQAPDIRAYNIYNHKTGGEIEICSESAFALHQLAFRRVGQQSNLRRVSPSNS